MLKRIGPLACLLSAGALLQPVAALAADRNYRNSGFESRNNAHVVQQYRAPERNDGWNRDRDDRFDRRDERSVDRDRVVLRTAPNFFYAPAARCR